MAQALKIKPPETRAWQGQGCIECNRKGYRGRVAIYEFFLMNDEIADLIVPDIKTGQLREAVRRYGWRPLREQAWFKVQAGLVPIAEIQRLTQRLDFQQAAAGPGAKL
jgi:type II secretory ATPase GspE/PulE/Tfp pilus assembly ATPase PilB-like protein